MWFMDGIYFNKFTWESTENKIINQKNAILKNLKNNPNNYFVNTYWFETLIEKIIKSENITNI